MYKTNDGHSIEKNKTYYGVAVFANYNGAFNIPKMRKCVCTTASSKLDNFVHFTVDDSFNTKIGWSKGLDGYYAENHHFNNDRYFIYRDKENAIEKYRKEMTKMLKTLEDHEKEISEKIRIAKEELVGEEK